MPKSFVVPLLRVACLCPAAILAGCAITSSHDNVAATAGMVGLQTSAAFSWRRSPAEDSAARVAVEKLLEGGITAQESVAIAFLASPELQSALERLEVSRADLIAASTFPNPVTVIGVREPGGSLAAFYPDRNLTIGVLQNVLAVINTPARRRVATRELERMRFEVAERIIGIAAETNQAFIEHLAALRIATLRRQNAQIARSGVEQLQRESPQESLGYAQALGVQFDVDSALSRAELDVQTTRARLGQQMGIIGWRDSWEISGELAALPDADPDLPALEAALPARRLDILAARKAVEARVAALNTQRRYRWLGAVELGVFRETSTGGTDFTGPNAVIEVPLFDQRQAQIASADAEARAGLRAAESLLMAARTDLRVHAAELAATRALADRQQKSVLPNHQRLLAALDILPEAGLMDRLQARIAALGAEEELLALRRDYWRARSALARSAGDWSSLVGW